MLKRSFKNSPGFCPDCGSIFPLLRRTGNVVCYNCKKAFPPDIFGAMEVEFTIHFNANSDDKKSKVRSHAGEEEEADGPTVERKCTKCGHDKMSYATVQLRSVDEGQTVFFTCLKCKHKESENS